MHAHNNEPILFAYSRILILRSLAGSTNVNLDQLPAWRWRWSVGFCVCGRRDAASLWPRRVVPLLVLINQRKCARAVCVCACMHAASERAVFGSMSARFVQHRVTVAAAAAATAATTTAARRQRFILRRSLSDPAAGSERERVPRHTL